MRGGCPQFAARNPGAGLVRGIVVGMPLPLLPRTLLPVLPLVVAVCLPLHTVSAADRQPAVAVPAARFSWPLAPPHPVLRRFDPPDAPWGAGHRGVDLGGTAGEPVLAVADGVVAFAGPLVYRGVVSVDHAGGLRSTYEPVEPAVTPGQAVTRGAVLGYLSPGHPGCLAPACLHWGVKRGDEYLDPLVLVATTGHVRLLPWRG
jgi:murein DD-endopeptidase MepM/ murein hydrolase activator NlpD